MVDYAQLLARAVATLDPNTPERREYIYDRARRALEDRFRNSNPPLSEEAWNAESTALEAAINRVEMDASGADGELEVSPGLEVYPAAAEAYENRAPLSGRRSRAGLLAGMVALLAVLLAGGLIYYFWPDVRSTAHNTLRTTNVTTPDEKRADDKNYIHMRQLVYYRTTYPVGTLVVDKPQSFLYVVRPSLAAMRYTINVNPECADLVGLYQVVRKEEWPGWSGSPQQADGSAGERAKNPLGARALDLNENRSIHGTGAASLSAAQEALKRCIGLVNDDVIDLYERTPVGSRVVVLSEKIEK
jgi:lipoprotein-anchoring transpeptidase ErfK/SrfK